MIDLLPLLRKMNPNLYITSSEKSDSDTDDIFTEQFYNFVHNIRRQIRNLEHFPIFDTNKKTYADIQKIKSHVGPQNNDTLNRIMTNIYNSLSQSYTNADLVYHTRQQDQHYLQIPNIVPSLELTNLTNKFDFATTIYTYTNTRHNEILKLEQHIQELNQLFIDMNVLVNIQGDLINRISYHIASTRDTCHVAQEEIVLAYKYKKRSKCVIM